MTPKTPTQRVADLRQRRKEQGLTRMEVYVHPKDHDKIKALADKLNKRLLTKPPSDA